MTKSTHQAEIEKLEHAFWESLIDNDPMVATAMLTEPSLMVGGHGAITFDHATYIRMATDAKHKVLEYGISGLEVPCPSDEVAIATCRVHQKVEMDGKPMEMDVVDSSTWVRIDGDWKCAAHTECPQAPKA